MRTTKQKTAKIVTYKIYGTDSYACDLYYYGKIRHSVMAQEEKHCVNAVKMWASGQGYTHIQLIVN